MSIKALSIKTAGKTTGLFASLMILAGGMSASALQPLPASAPLLSTLPGLVSRRIQLDLAKRLNVPAQNIVVKEAMPQTWNDQCLGLARPGERCAGGETRGWQVEVESWQQRWTYRSDRTARRLRLEPLPNATDLNPADFSTSISQTLLKTVSQQVQQPTDNLQILEVQAATWDSCLGLVPPDGTVCTPAHIPGFRVIVNDGPKEGIGRLQRRAWPEHREFQREWVYHLSADATQIFQNTAASDTQGLVSSQFSSLNTTKQLGEQVVFQMVANSYVDPTDTIATLSADGELKLELVSYRIGETSSSGEENTPEVISIQIPPDEVAAFEQLLQQQFSNFHGMSYSNERPNAAIDGQVTYYTPEASVGVGAFEEDLPASLHAVTEAWFLLVPFF